MSTRGYALLMLAAVGSGCSLLVSFDPESQQCDQAGACLPGYLCSDAGLCKATDAGSQPPDAGGTDGATCAARETVCGDGRDNDCDGQTDCADSDCDTFGCDDRDLCTTGEICSARTCARGTPVVCNMPPNGCQAPTGTCEATSGRCVYAALSDGVSCGLGLSSRCCAGTCINTAVNPSHCGGCGLMCATNQNCQQIDASACMANEPANTSGRCSCGTGIACPRGQTCGADNRCFPTLAAECAPGQMVADAGVCAGYCRY